MNQKTVKILFWITSGLFSLMMLASAGMYVFNYGEISEIFQKLGHPTHVIYPLAVFKLLGVIAILSRKSKTLLEWAYAGFFFDFLLAFAAHYSINDGEHYGALMAMVLLLSSYFLGKRIS